MDVCLQQTSATRRSFPTQPITFSTRKARAGTSISCNLTVAEPDVTTSGSTVEVLSRHKSSTSFPDTLGPVNAGNSLGSCIATGLCTKSLCRNRCGFAASMCGGLCLAVKTTLNAAAAPLVRALPPRFLDQGSNEGRSPNDERAFRQGRALPHIGAAKPLRTD